jgi:hypothetical protein
MTELTPTGAVPSPPAEPPAPHLAPHAVPWQHAIAWFEDAMRLFKWRPVTWMALALVTVVVDLVCQALPDPWTVLGKFATPLVACGLVYAAAAADRHTTVRLGFALRAFGLPTGTLLAVLLASFVTFAAEAATAWWLADVNLLTSAHDARDLSVAAVFGVYAIGVLVSLPITFVPFAALFERVALRPAFAASWRAFVLNTPPLIVYGGISLALLGLGVATLGLGLLLVLPLWAASSYLAWKDIFGIKEAPEA